MNEEQFINNLEEINIKIDKNQLDLLNKYYNLLIENNKVMNLTGIVEKKEVYLKHFYDSLTLNKIIDLNSIHTLCDLGSGAGFPGIVIKILFPKIKITLIDSLNKRVDFLKYTIKELGLSNIEAVSIRIEDYSVLHKEEYDLVTARAVTKTNILLELGVQLIKVNGLFVTMKGKRENFNQELLNKLSLIQTKEIEFKLPIENSDRTLTIFKKQNPTSSIFPRRYSEIKKNPL